MLTKPGAAFSFQRSKIVVKRKGNVLTSENARNAEKARAIAAEMAALLSRDDFTFVNNLNSRNDETCIICIGSTGTGKSATIAKCTGQDVPCGSGSARVTVQCATYSSGRVVPGQEPDPVWVDTVGWDDADLDDERTFKEILNFIGQKHLLRVKAIIWTILPNVRKDRLLAKQAKLINLFKSRNIWKNVILICKQSRNLKDDSQGALSAVKEFNQEVQIPVLGYTFLGDGSLTPMQRSRLQDKSQREDFLVKTDDEVKEMVLKTIDKLGDPIQVVFKNQLCLDCGQRGDARLMTEFCHMEKSQVHIGSIIQFHPGQVERFHPSSVIIREHPGGLYKPWFSCDFFLCKCGGERYSCCGSLGGQPGCQQVRTCCKKLVSDFQGDEDGCEERYSCCKINVTSPVSGCRSKFDCCDQNVKSAGCVERCKKCDQPWGSDPGSCFEKDHNIVTVETLKRSGKNQG